MQINKISINNFGKLENKDIELENGINLIQGENETGKSTVAEFIKLIFYGISKNKNGKMYSDYERYSPWNGGVFSGSIEYEIDEKKYNLYRDFNNNKAVIHDEFNNDITANYSKNKSRGAEIGYEQLKIDEDVFENSILVRQSETKVDTLSQSTIIQKIGNAIQTGDESLSYDDIIKKLEKRMYDEIGTDRTTTKPKFMLKKEISDLEVRESKLVYNKEKSQRIKEEKETILQDSNLLREEESLLEEITKIKENYENEIQYEKTKYEIEKKSKEEAVEKRRAGIKKKQKIDLIVLFVIVVGLTSFLLYKGYYPYAIGTIIVGVIASIVYLKTNNKEEIEVETGNFDLVVEDIKKRMNNKLGDYNDNLKAKKYLELSLVQLKSELLELRNKLNQKELDLHKLKIEEEAISNDVEDLNEVVENLCFKKQEYEELLKKEKVMSIGIDLLKQSYDDVKRKIIPQLENDIKFAVAKTTNNKYKEIVYNDTKGLQAKNEYNQIVELDKLSAGTIDQIYLGFRLAIADKYNGLPIVFDDAFVYYDENRLKNVLKTLSEIAETKQIIILSCSDREKLLLDDLKIKYNMIKM